MGKGLRIAVLLALILFLASCTLSSELSPTSPPVATLVSPQPASFQVYFTDPAAPEAASYQGGPDEPLAQAIAGAHSSLDVAIYDINLTSITQALLSAAERGVTVRVVTESDNTDETAIQSLKDGGIPVLGDRREGLMHNKFLVIDRQEVWTGSMNYTTSDTYRNNNNLIRIRSSRLAEDYEAEFDEMFVQDQFGPDKAPDTPYPQVTIDGTLVEVYFSPSDHPGPHLEQLIDGAQHSIHFLAFSFTANNLGQAIVARSRAGVQVQGVMEASQVASNIGTEWDRFSAAGLDVRQDGNHYNMHDKVLIIDDQIVVTGSYNFSASAEKTNDENLLIIYNAQIAHLYQAEFEKIFAQAPPK